MKEENRFKKLLDAKELTQSGLLRTILKEVDPENKINFKNAKGNFSKMISGSRPFPENYIVIIEQVLNTTISYIRTGKHNGISNTFVNKGIRYAAYLDEFFEYNILNEQGANSDPLRSFDEFDKTILDYIIEYKAINGLRYLINNKYIYLNYDGKTISGISAITNNILKEVLKIIYENDDLELFNKLCINNFNNIKYFNEQSKVFLDDELVIALFNTKKIFKSLLTTNKNTLSIVNGGFQTIIPDSNVYFYNPLVLKMFEYGFNNYDDNWEKVDDILDFAIKHNKEVIYNSEITFELIKISTDGTLFAGITCYGNIFNLNLTQDVLENKGVSRRKNLMVLENDIKHFVTLLETPNVTFKRKKSNNEYEYKLYEILDELNYKKVPKYLGNNYDNVDEFEVLSNFERSRVLNLTEDIVVKVINEILHIQEITKNKEDEEKVYVHGNLIRENIHLENRQLIMISGFENTYIGNNYTDIITIILDYLNIDQFPRYNDEEYHKLKSLIKKTNLNNELKRNFSNKMLEVLDEKMNYINKNSDNYTKLYESVGWSKLWVELYKDKIEKEIG